MQVWESVAAERRALADLLDTLSPEQLATPSLCDAWTVREVAAHLVVSHTVTMPGFAVALARARGSFARANVSLTTSQAARPTNELVADLRKHAQSRFAPPGMGPGAPVTDVFVHAQDIRIPLALYGGPAAERWVPVLDFLTSSKARRGFVSGRPPAVCLAATDVDWVCGSGPEVLGSAMALAMTLAGRTALADGLSGAGAATLSAWAGP